MSVNHCPTARLDHLDLAYRALANRWLVIIFRMWQDRSLYDEDYHLCNIAQRGAKLPL